MTVYLTKTADEITLTARAEGEGGRVGDLVEVVKAGQSAFGRTYAEWRALPPGPHEYPAPDAK